MKTSWEKYEAEGWNEQGRELEKAIEKVEDPGHRAIALALQIISDRLGSLVRETRAIGMGNASPNGFGALESMSINLDERLERIAEALESSER